MNEFASLDAQNAEHALAQVEPQEMAEFIETHNASVRDPQPEDFI